MEGTSVHRMIWIALLAMPALAGCSQGDASQWNAQAADELKGKTEQMFRDIDFGNGTALMAWADKNTVMFDLDMNNNPVTARGTDDVGKYFAAMQAGVMDKGLSFRSRIVRQDCAATTVMGVCAVDFDQTISQGGQSMGPFKYRGTLVAHKANGDWQWVHWHSSFRELPPAR